MIYLRHRYAAQEPYEYATVAWIHRPGLGGPNKPVQMDDSRLQAVMDRAHAQFGTPGLVLEIPDRLPEPSAAALAHWGGGPDKKGKK